MEGEDLDLGNYEQEDTTLKHSGTPRQLGVESESHIPLEKIVSARSDSIVQKEGLRSYDLVGVHAAVLASGIRGTKGYNSLLHELGKKAPSNARYISDLTAPTYVPGEKAMYFISGTAIVPKN